MIEVPISEFGQNTPVIAEPGEGGPATAPGYTLHGVWHFSGSDSVCCWQVKDDTISICGVRVGGVHEHGYVGQPRKLRFEGSILPRPSLFAVGGEGGEDRTTHYLVLCTSKGEVKVVPLRVNGQSVDATMPAPFPTMTLQNAQRVTSCNLLRKSDGEVKAFIGISNWGQHDADATLAEVRVVDVNLKEPGYKESAALKFTNWVGRSKKVTAVAASKHPFSEDAYLITTLQGAEAVIYQVKQGSTPGEVLRFTVATPPHFSTDINVLISNRCLIAAFIESRPTPTVHVFRIDVATNAYSLLCSRPSPMPPTVPTRASIRTTSSALYVVWQAEPHVPQDALQVPLLFSALQSAPAPQLAITRLSLEQPSITKEWQMVDLESKKRASLGHGEVGLCVVDGNDLSGTDMCFMIHPHGISVLRDADPLETEGILGCATDDVSGMEPLNHPYVSYSLTSNKPINQSEFLRAWKQCDTVISLVMPVIEALLPKLLSAKADDLSSTLADIEFLLFMESDMEQQEVAQVHIDNLLRVAAEIAKRVDQGYTTDVAGTPLAALGTAQQMAFSMLMLSLHRAALLSVARHIAVGGEVTEVDAQLRDAIDKLMLYSHVYSVFGTEHIQLSHLAAVAGTDLTSVRLFTSVRDTIQMLTETTDIPASQLLSSLLASPITVPGHVSAVLSLQQSAVSSDYKRLVVSHIYANMMLLEADTVEVTARFHAVSEGLQHLPPAEQDMFMSFIISLVPHGLHCNWGSASFGVNRKTLYLYISVASLVFLDDTRKLDSVDAALGRNGTLTSALRTAVVAIMPPVEHLLSHVTVWSPPAWDIVLRVNTWTFERALESCGKAVHLQGSAAGHVEKSNSWDSVFRAVASCPDPRVMEQQVSTLVETIVSSGSLAVQRFLATNWGSRASTPLVSAITNNDSTHALLTVTLPPVGSLPQAYSEARAACRDIVVSVVSGRHDQGQGIALKKDFGHNAEEVCNTVIRIPTSAADTYQVGVGPLLQDVRSEGRPMLLVVSYAGAVPAVLRCTATGSSLSLAPNHAYEARPSSVICKVLWNKGNDKFITDLVGKHGGANYFHLLAQFLARRMEYGAAARATYRIAEKIRAAPRAGLQDIEAASRALAMAISFLKVGRLESFCLQCTEAQAKEDEVVTLDDLQHRRVTVEAELALLRSSGDGTVTPLQLQQAACEEILDMLLARKLFVQAATFADAWRLGMQKLFVAGVQACLTAEEQPVARVVKTTLWNEILLLLEKYSTEGVQWKYHVAVVETFLKEVPVSELPPSRAVEPLRYNRPDQLVRELLRCGSLVCLTEAVGCAVGYLRWQLVDRSTDEFVKKAVIPVTLLDTLVDVVAGKVKDLPSSPSQQEILFKCKAEDLFNYWKAPPTTTTTIAVAGSQPVPQPAAVPSFGAGGGFFGAAQGMAAAKVF